MVNRVATSYSFTEGWAHYTEQMMLETKYGEGQPNLLLTQLLEALVRNCRYMCSLSMAGRSSGNAGPPKESRRSWNPFRL